MTVQRTEKGRVTYSNENWNGFSFFTLLRNYKEYATPYTEFNRLDAEGNIVPVRDYQMTEFEVKLRYAPNEILPSRKLPLSDHTRRTGIYLEPYGSRKRCAGVILFL